MDAPAWILFAITVGSTFVAIIGAAIKYGSDQKEYEAKNRMQDLVIDNLSQRVDDLKEAHQEEKSHNADQHREFYDVKNSVLKMEATMEYLKNGIDEIKGLVRSAK